MIYKKLQQDKIKPAQKLNILIIVDNIMRIWYNVTTMFFKESKTMKKIALILAAALIAVTSIFCFAGCGETPEQKLANYIASDTCQKDIDTLKSSFGSTLDIDVKAEGENVVFTFAYKTDLPEESLDTVKSTLETGFDSMSSTFEGFANDIKDEAGVDNPSVVIEINTKDGKNLFSKTYHATK